MTTCRLCHQLADYMDETNGELLCWLHAVDRRYVRGSVVSPVMLYNGLAYLDLGRCAQDCICECGAEYRKHLAPFPDCPTQVLLCNLKTAKL